MKVTKINVFTLISFSFHFWPKGYNSHAHSPLRQKMLMDLLLLHDIILTQATVGGQDMEFPIQARRENVE